MYLPVSTNGLETYDFSFSAFFLLYKQQLTPDANLSTVPPPPPPRSTTYTWAWDEKWLICRKSLLSAWKHCFSAHFLGSPLIHDYLVFLLYFPSTVMYNVLSSLGIAVLSLVQVTNAIKATHTLACLWISARCAKRWELRFTVSHSYSCLMLFISAKKKTYLCYSMVLALCDPYTCDSYVVIDSSLQYSLYSLFHICFITLKHKLLCLCWQAYMYKHASLKD